MERSNITSKKVQCAKKHEQSDNDSCFKQSPRLAELENKGLLPIWLMMGKVAEALIKCGYFVQQVNAMGKSTIEDKNIMMEIVQIAKLIYATRAYGDLLDSGQHRETAAGSGRKNHSQTFSASHAIIGQLESTRSAVNKRK